MSCSSKVSWTFELLHDVENPSKSLRAAEKSQEKVEANCTGFSAEFFGSQSVEMFCFARKTKIQKLTTFCWSLTWIHQLLTTLKPKEPGLFGQLTGGRQFHSFNPKAFNCIIYCMFFFLKSWKLQNHIYFFSGEDEDAGETDHFDALETVSNEFTYGNFLWTLR